jgi:hypothetical protein
VGYSSGCSDICLVSKSTLRSSLPGTHTHTRQPEIGYPSIYCSATFDYHIPDCPVAATTLCSPAAIENLHGQSLRTPILQDSRGIRAFRQAPNSSTFSSNRASARKRESHRYTHPTAATIFCRCKYTSHRSFVCIFEHRTVGPQRACQVRIHGSSLFCDPIDMLLSSHGLYFMAIRLRTFSCLLFPCLPCFFTYSSG